MLCLNCGPQYHLISACSYLTPKQRTFFVELFAQQEAKIYGNNAAVEDEDKASEAVTSEEDVFPEETAYAELEAEELEKIDTPLYSASMPVFNATIYLHQRSLLKNAT